MKYYRKLGYIEVRTMVKRICQQQPALLGQIMRRHGVENLVVTGRIEGRQQGSTRDFGQFVQVVEG